MDDQPEQRDVMVDITLEGEHDEKKNVGDGIDADSNSNLDEIDYIFESDSEYDEDEVVEKQLYNAPRLEKEEIGVAISINYQCDSDHVGYFIHDTRSFYN